MILLTGGLEFLDLNTVRALLEVGEACVLTQHCVVCIPAALKDEVGSHLFIEPLDVTDANALLQLRERHPITRIVHLAACITTGPGVSTLALFSACRAGRDAGAGKKRARDGERIELSVAELRCLLQALREPEEQCRKRLWWSRFRRMHQAVAKRCHQVRRARQAPLPASANPRPIRVLVLGKCREPDLRLWGTGSFIDRRCLL